MAAIFPACAGVLRPDKRGAATINFGVGQPLAYPTWQNGGQNLKPIRIMKRESVVFDAAPAYPAGVNVAELLTEIEAVIKKHVVLNPEAAAALAVWVLHTYTFELRDAVAYVAIESPEKRCGKTTLISVLAAMAHKPLIASNITVGALFRA